jgi:hypothetical protein
VGYLRHARTYDRSQTRDRLRARAYGDGATIVVVGVTPHHGDGNTASQGEGWQVTTMHSRGGTRDAHSRNRPEHHPRTSWFRSRSLESLVRRKRSCGIRRGADRKVPARADNSLAAYSTLW